jgi:hypothetical protein
MNARTLTVTCAVQRTIGLIYDMSATCECEWCKAAVLEKAFTHTRLLLLSTIRRSCNTALCSPCTDNLVNELP